MKNFILGLVAIGLVIFIVISFKGNKSVNIENVQEVIDGNNIQDDGGGIDDVGQVDSENLSQISSLMVDGVWVWDRTVMNDDTTIIPAVNDAFTLTFDGQKVYGTTDCNNFNGEYFLNGYNSISFGPMAQTMMFCENSQESAFLKNVTDSNSVYFDEGNLVLLLPYDSGSVIFTKKQ